MDSNKKINNLRKEIDKIDLVKLIKVYLPDFDHIETGKNLDQKIKDDIHENQIIMYLSTKANSDLKKEDISDIFELIFNISKKNQKIK